MDKTYDQKTVEEKWYKFWEDSGFFKADPNSSEPPYGLLIPPPNLTGSPHLGHAMQHAILDAIARFKRMQGFDVLLLPGVDHAGIQFEGTLNKLLEKEGTSKQKLGRDEWMKRAWQFKEEVYKTFHNTWTVFGLSADWSREVFTLEEKVQKAVLEEFKSFWEQDLLYKGAYIVQWCPKDQTAIEDVEMEYEERKEKLYFIKYQVENSDEAITIATARPETIAADVAIAIYPKHPKYTHLVGKNAINPFTQTKIPILEDERVEKDFGTGALKITPGHDLLDYEIGKDHNLSTLHVIDKTGRVTELDPNLKGLKILEARTKATELLKAQIEKQEEYTHSVPICERCKTTVEPLISEEWFVKMEPLAKKALKRINEVNFVPKNYQKILSDWMEVIRDWCISRSLWWGHRIPVWYCQKCNPNHLVGRDRDMVISLEEPGKNCQTCNQKHWVQDEQVLDTWFSSGLWPMATLGWPVQSKEFEKYYPWQFELSAPEIKYLWIARMIMLGLHFTQKVPFENMFFHGMIRDLHSYAAPGRDGKASRQTMDERCKNFRNFGTKLRNIARFIVELKPEGAKSMYEDIPTVQSLSNPNDKEIIEKLNQITKDVTKDLEGFNLHLAIDKLYEFIWHEFADKYIEITKNRRIETQPILEYVFKTSLELLHPFMPFITEELWQKLPHEGKSIMITTWPTI
ncbi:valine--tRNA ligase [Candidatus Daviesbacteria bacterium]|nr:valine--tRNA ligase [Candidatus Daviesbacteria bacterium]